MRLTTRLATRYQLASDPSAELEVFTFEALRQLAEGAKGTPLTVEFDPERIVGWVADAYVVADAVLVQIDITDLATAERLMPGQGDFQIAPGFTVDAAAWHEHREILSLTVYQVSVLFPER